MMKWLFRRLIETPRVVNIQVEGGPIPLELLQRGERDKKKLIEKFTNKKSFRLEDYPIPPPLRGVYG